MHKTNREALPADLPTAVKALVARGWDSFRTLESSSSLLWDASWTDLPLHGDVTVAPVTILTIYSDGSASVWVAGSEVPLRMDQPWWLSDFMNALTDIEKIRYLR